uniref:Uncharacterized protein n=1 Tax=Caenorhabditis japonica TaxID=281687 RepID=A0A8R1EA41_CAEJA
MEKKKKKKKKDVFLSLCVCWVRIVCLYVLHLIDDLFFFFFFLLLLFPLFAASLRDSPPIAHQFSFSCQSGRLLFVGTDLV